MQPDIEHRRLKFNFFKMHMQGLSQAAPLRQSRSATEIVP